MSVLTTSAPEALALTEVRDAAGISRAAMYKAVDAGLVTPTGAHKERYNVRGRRPQVLTPEDAAMVILAAGLAATAGTAFLTMLRALRQTGATIEADRGAVVIPLPVRARGCTAA